MTYISRSASISVRGKGWWLVGARGNREGPGGGLRETSFDVTKGIISLGVFLLLVQAGINLHE